MDGNSSAKRLAGAGSSDHRTFLSNYIIPFSEVERFKDDVRLRPGAARHQTGSRTPSSQPSASQPPTIHPVSAPTIEADAIDSGESSSSRPSGCTSNWTAANTVAEGTTTVFDQTGIFISTCRHAIVQTIVEMRRSGELYAMPSFDFILSLSSYKWEVHDSYRQQTA